MGLITGFDADYLDQIVAATVVGGAADPTTGELTLITKDGSVIDAGNVKGPKGDPSTVPGPIGPGNATDAQVAALINLANSASQLAADARVTRVTNPLATRITALEADTGWVNVPLASGYSAAQVLGVADTPKYRVYHGVVYYKGTIAPSNGSSFAPNSSYSISAVLPAVIVPDGTNDALTTISGSASTGPVRAYVSAADAVIRVQTSDVGASSIPIAGLSGYLATP